MRALKLHSYPTVDYQGYGVAYKQLLNVLERHDDLHFFENAPNILNFCKPQDYQFEGITIGYTPWESTKIPDEWVEPMKRVTELWTPASWMANIMQQQIQREVWTLPHGIGSTWQPIRHSRQDFRPFTFIHVGEPAVRKGGDILLQVWDRHFKNKDVKLILKCNGFCASRVYDKQGQVKATPYEYSNIQIIDKIMHPAELWQLYALSDCMVYPSRGEGFGMIPLEAMASGLPTILPTKSMGDFCWYGIGLYGSSYVNIPASYQSIHPGKWLTHDEDELIDIMEQVIANYDKYAFATYKTAFPLHRKFNWESIANQIFAKIAPL